MLAKIYRLRRSSEFDDVFKNGRKLVCLNLVIYSLKKSSDLESRLGLVVSGKVGNAVIRNRIKRVLRHAFQKQLQTGACKVLLGTDFVIVARNSAAKLAWTGLEESFEVCMSRFIKGILK